MIMYMIMSVPLCMYNDVRVYDYECMYDCMIMYACR